MELKAYRNIPQASYDRQCITCTQPHDDPDIVFFSKHWKVLLHPDHSSLGNCLIGSLRHVPKISELSSDEASEFMEVFRVLEPALERAFGAELINLSCERNWAYRTDNPDPPFLKGQPNPHVHWHVATRYSSPQEFAGLKFEDPTFGEPFEWRSLRLESEQKLKIIEKLRGELEITYR